MFNTVALHKQWSTVTAHCPLNPFKVRYFLNSIRYFLNFIRYFLNFIRYFLNFIRYLEMFMQSCGAVHYSCTVCCSLCHVCCCYFSCVFMSIFLDIYCIDARKLYFLSRLAPRLLIDSRYSLRSLEIHQNFLGNSRISYTIAINNYYCICITFFVFYLHLYIL